MLRATGHARMVTCRAARLLSTFPSDLCCEATKPEVPRQMVTGPRAQCSRILGAQCLSHVETKIDSIYAQRAALRAAGQATSGNWLPNVVWPAAAARQLPPHNF